MESEVKYYNALAVRARGDEEAFTEMYRHFFPRVYNFIYARMKDVDAADDVVSTTFMKVYENLDRYNPTKAAFSTWLFRIASNSMVDYFRRTQNCVEVEWDETFDPPAPEYQAPEAQALDKEGKAEILKALDKLNERERRIVELKYFSDMGNKEIAEVLEISANNVGVVLHGALKKLRKILGEE
ncbi:MAG: sigma-70 family RNA polymerase sigma factor [Selenomonadaceae bacterium]|nr:sigma-70 family RNA polymerase sigma factor [Selenomonadaceae bacterium]